MFEGVGRRHEKTGTLVSIGADSLNGNERNLLFRNNGDGSFTDVGWVCGADRVEDGRGLSIFDLDRNGTLDVALRNFRQPAQLLRNRPGAGHWLRLRLIGVRSNRDAIGARARVRTSRGWQTRHVSAGSGYLSGQSLIQHFGLGSDGEAVEVEIAWPSGRQTRLERVPGDRLHVVVEGTEPTADTGHY